MASGQTTNLALSQWGAADRVTRADFNGDNQKIDAAVGALRTADATMQGNISALQGSVSSLQTAVAGKCSVIVGSYIGDGAAERTISLGVTPKAVLVSMRFGIVTDRNHTYAYGGVALTGAPAMHNEAAAVEIINGGFQVAYHGNPLYIYTNISGNSYSYVALY